MSMRLSFFFILFCFRSNYINALRIGTKTGTSWSTHGMGHRPAPLNSGRCYVICPNVVFPQSSNPVADDPFFIYESELHGGPFGQNTMNPYGGGSFGHITSPAGDVTHPVAGHWPGIRRPVVPRALPEPRPYDNPFPYNINPLKSNIMLELDSKVNVKVSNKLRGNTESPHQNVHPACYKVCPHTDAPNPDEESHGGPFGPDPYYSNKNMFNKHHMGDFRNPHGDTYGGPFGPAPHDSFGNHELSIAIPRTTWGAPTK